MVFNFCSAIATCTSSTYVYMYLFTPTTHTKPCMIDPLYEILAVLIVNDCCISYYDNSNNNSITPKLYYTYVSLYMGSE